MDVVYKDAEMTIVAAAGTSADNDLPGDGRATTNHRSASATISVYLARQQQEGFACPSPHFSGGAKDHECIQGAGIQDAYFRKLPVEWRYVNSTPLTSDILSSGKVFALYAFEHHVTEFTQRKLPWFAESADSAAKFEFPLSIAFSFPGSASGPTINKRRKSKLSMRPVHAWRPNSKDHGSPMELLFRATLYDIPLRVGNPVPRWDGKDFGAYLDDKVINRRLHLTQVVKSGHETIRETKLSGLILGTALNIRCHHVLVIREVASRGTALAQFMEGDALRDLA
ncbi:hypothetical protein PG997_008699 [Apiospora hydei]|uniref:Uncharacterized protein n=1 Tax=Apiospora hydei TaxID=1337664 RepID=A0ABR1WBJ1_9PEZI